MSNQQHRHYEYEVILSDNTKAEKWVQDHERIALRLSQGWQIASSHAVAGNGQLIVYTFMTRMSDPIPPAAPEQEPSQ